MEREYKYANFQDIMDHCESAQIDPKLIYSFMEDAVNANEFLYKNSEGYIHNHTPISDDIELNLKYTLEYLEIYKRYNAYSNADNFLYWFRMLINPCKYYTSPKLMTVSVNVTYLLDFISNSIEDLEVHPGMSAAALQESKKFSRIISSMLKSPNL